MTICIIPARGGSSRIPGKNRREFLGKPMICWSIEAAIKSRCFDRIIVSTDDSDIANIAVASGATVPFIRPAHLSDDYTSTRAVIKHAIDSVVSPANGASGSALPVCCLYATAPFVRAEDITLGLELLNKADYVVPVTTFAYPIQRAVVIDGRGKLKMRDMMQYQARSQDLEECWHDAGQFYWGTAGAWVNESIPFLLEAVPLKLPRWRVQDIDTEEDWLRAEAMFLALGFVK